MGSDIYKREYSLTEILSYSWSLFRDNAITIIAILLLVGIPIHAVNILANENLAVTIPELDNPDLSPEEANALIELHMDEIIVSTVTMLIIAIIASLISMVSAMALAFFVKSCADNKKISLQTAYMKALKKLPLAIFTGIILLLLLIPLYLLIIIPGIIYSVYWGFAITAVALSGKSGKAAMDHSKMIVKKRWWNVFAIAFVLSLVSGFSILAPAGFLPGIIFLTLLNIVSSYLFVTQVIMYLNYESNIRPQDRKA
jgi:hypothetical protein